jgi:hypothetical protein
MGYSSAVTRLGSLVGSSRLEDLQHVCGPLERSRTLLHSQENGGAVY